jgi:hypothetical protein
VPSVLILFYFSFRILSFSLSSESLSAYCSPPSCSVRAVNIIFSFVDLNYCPRTTIYLNSEISVATLVVSKLSYESSASTTQSSLGSRLEEVQGVDADVDADDKVVSAPGSSESAQGDPGSAEGVRVGLEEFREDSSRSSESTQDDAEGVCGP